MNILKGKTMNVIKNIRALLIVLLVFGLVSCDKIEPPYMNEIDNHNDDDTEVVRKILLEEFTGHLCPNCPAGKEVSEELKGIYGNRIVVMSIHTGIFARPIPDGFENDYRTAEGGAIATAFGVNQYPVGMVNRKNFDGSVVLSPSAWGSAVAEIIEEEPPLRIQIQNSYNSSNRYLEVSLNTTILIEQEGQYFLSVFLLEDGMISPQKTDNETDYPDGIIYDYEHNNVLRAAINSTWGEKLTDEGLMSGETYSKTYSINIDADWDHSNCKVVAFVYNGDSMEVIQTEVKAIIQ